MEKFAKAVDDDESPEFFKVYFAQLCAEQLKIPPDFVAKFDGDVPKKFILKGPKGRSWQAVVKKVDQYFFLQEGWKIFVQDNSLVDGDFLTFCYDGGSKFHVKIFGKDGCRKDVATTSRNHNATEQLHDHAGKSSSSHNATEQLHDHAGKSSSSHDAMEQLHDHAGKSSSSHDAMEQLHDHAGKSSSSHDAMEQLHDHAGKPSSSRLTRRKLWTQTPPFTRIMTQYYLTKCLILPRSFSQSYIKKKLTDRRKAILQVENKQWEVSIAKCGDRYRFCNGWPLFTKENSLKQGHKCTFQPIDKKNDDVVMEVTFSKRLNT